MTTYQHNGLERQETACCDIVLAGQRTSNAILTDSAELDREMKALEEAMEEEQKEALNFNEIGMVDY